VTRAFGDAAYKWSREKSLELRKTFWATKPKSAIKSAPYMTAEPIITTTKIEPDKGDFVVMASDALWEMMLSNEEVAGLVGKWIASRPGKDQKPTEKSSSNFFSTSTDKLPIVPGPLADRIEEDLEEDEQPHRPRQWQMKRRLSRFVVQDQNAATHIARNAFGGSETDLMAGLLALSTPNSRRFRYVPVIEGSRS
jgi:pyruvate dehydrogenase phosphatase